MLWIGGGIEIVTQVTGPRFKSKEDSHRGHPLSSSVLHTYVSTPIHTSKHHKQKETKREKKLLRTKQNKTIKK